MTPATNKLLIISHDFPPSALVGAKRVAAFTRYLPEFNVDPLILTAKEEFYEALDDSFFSFQRLRIYRTIVLPNPLTALVKLKKRLFPSSDSIEFGSTEESNLLSWRAHVLGLFAAPNDNIGWYLPALFKGTRIIQSQDIDGILSSGPPWGTHLIALTLKKVYGSFWAADFRDPWTHGIEWADMPQWRRRLEKRLERWCIEAADVVICNTERARAVFVTAYPGSDAEKFVTITNGFLDPPGEASGEPRTPGPFTFLHLGSLEKERQNETFFQAIENLISNGMDPSSMRFRFVGITDPSFTARLKQKFPNSIASGSVEFMERVKWEIGQQMLRDSDVLLLFQGRHELQIPAKFYEYLPKNKELMVVADEGALTDIVRATDSGVCVAPTDLAAIESLIKKLCAQSGKRLPVRTSVGQFHYREITRQLARTLFGTQQGA
jgi:glycosyltransferase involved in cell wall biosynthesis